MIRTLRTLWTRSDPGSVRPSGWLRSRSDGRAAWPAPCAGKRPRGLRTAFLAKGEPQLLGRAQPFRAVGPKRRAGLVDLQRAEEVAAKEAVFACRLLRRARLDHAAPTSPRRTTRTQGHHSMRPRHAARGRETRFPLVWGFWNRPARDPRTKPRPSPYEVADKQTSPLRGGLHRAVWGHFRDRWPKTTTTPWLSAPASSGSRSPVSCRTAPIGAGARRRARGVAERTSELARQRRHPWGHLLRAGIAGGPPVRRRRRAVVAHCQARGVDGRHVGKLSRPAPRRAACPR